MNYEITLVFAHVVLTKTLGILRGREIRQRKTRRMELWEKGLHMGLVGKWRWREIPGKAETLGENMRRENI